MTLSEGPTPETSLANPAIWINLGAVGVFLYYFITDKVFSKGAMEKVERLAQKSEEKQDKQIERIIGERDRALAERDEMIEVMTNFTRTASALLQFEIPPHKPPPRRPDR